MIVSELVKKLQKCNPDAEVHTEQWQENEIRKVKEYTNGNQDLVYIGDDFDELEYTLEEQGFTEKK